MRLLSRSGNKRKRIGRAKKSDSVIYHLQTDAVHYVRLSEKESIRPRRTEQNDSAPFQVSLLLKRDVGAISIQCPVSRANKSPFFVLFPLQDHDQSEYFRSESIRTIPDIFCTPRVFFVSLSALYFSSLIRLISFIFCQILFYNNSNSDYYFIT